MEEPLEEPLERKESMDLVGSNMRSEAPISVGDESLDRGQGADGGGQDSPFMLGGGLHGSSSAAPQMPFSFASAGVAGGRGSRPHHSLFQTPALMGGPMDGPVGSLSRDSLY